MGCLRSVFFRLDGLRGEESQQFGVHFFGVRPRNAVRPTLYNPRRAPLMKPAVRCPEAILTGERPSWEFSINSAVNDPAERHNHYSLITARPDSGSTCF